MEASNITFGANNSGLAMGINNGNVFAEFNVSGEKSEAERNRNCLQDLYQSDPRDDKSRIEGVKGGLLKDAYRWALDNADYQQWRDDPNSRLLWVKGDPGKGKTMLLCGLIDELTTSAPSTAVFSYFFCEASNAKLNSALAILRGLIYLLVDKQPSLISYVRERYDQREKQLFTDSNAWVALSKILTSILADPNLQEVFLVIDALDECTIDRRLLLDLICQISSRHSHVKWIVSSRNEPEIEDRLHSATEMRLSLELNEQFVSEAVTIYIRFRVQKLVAKGRYKDDLRDDILHHLLSNSQGTFLWVSLVCDELDSKSAWKARSLLKTFPPGLSPLYGSMMNRICESEDSELYKRILSAVLLLYQPITLDEFPTLVDLPEDVVDDDEFLTEILGGCCSFLILRDRTIFFVHLSAKEFLLGQGSNDLFPLGIETEHYTIFQRSLQALQGLKYDIYQLKLPCLSVKKVRQPDPDPLAAIRYSCLYWADHLYDCHTSGVAQDDLRETGAVGSFFNEKLLYWLESLSLLRHVSQGITAMFKLSGLLQTIGEKGSLLGQIHDAIRFTRNHRLAIENWPLQVYCSSLLFSPGQSKTRLRYQAQAPKWILGVRGIESRWNSCIFTLEGHKGGANSVAWSLDGLRLASGSIDKTIKLWDTSTGQCISTFKGHGKVITSVAWSPDGTRLASGSTDATVKSWDTATAQCIATFEEHSAAIECVTWSQDRNRLASWSKNGEIIIWDLMAGESVRTLEWYYNMSFAWSEDGTRVAKIKGDGKILVGDPVTGDHLSTFGDETACRPLVPLVSLSHDGKRLASFDRHSDKISTWDPISGDCLSIFSLVQERKWPIFDIVWSYDGRRFATREMDGGVHICDLTTEKCSSTLTGHKSFVSSLSWSQDGSRLAGSCAHSVRIWNSFTGDCTAALDGHTDTIRSVEWSPDGTRVASASHDANIRIWDATVQHTSSLPKHGDGVKSIIWSPDRSRVISGANDLTARIWDATSGDCTLVLDGENRGLAAAAWSHDSKLIASSFQFQRYGLDASRERSSVLDEVATRTKMTGWRQKGKNKHDGWDFTVWIWCPDTGQLISSFEDLRYPVSAIAWSHDNTRLAAAETSWGGGIKIWNIATGQCLLTVDRPGEEEEKEEGWEKGDEGDEEEEGGGSPKWFAKSLSWSPDESRLALGSDINTVKILDLATKQVISTFEHGHDDKKIISVAWSHDGSRLASGSTENTVKIWDTATGQCIAALAVYSPKNLQFGSSNPNELVTPIGTFELDAIISACGSSDCSAVSPSQPAYDLQGEWITHGGKDFIWLPPDYRPGAWARCGTSLAIGSSLGQVFIVNFAGNKTHQP